MNKIVLRNCILRNIKQSHKIGSIQFNEADCIVRRNNLAKEDVIKLKFKSLLSIYRDGDIVDLIGNVRSYNNKTANKNSVQIYVFTYFDKPDDLNDLTNYVELDGNICSIEPLKVLDNKKELVHFILANNIIKDGQKINNYIPCVAWGLLAREIASFPIGLHLYLLGELHSREYKKKLEDGIEIKVAHELYVKQYVLTPWKKDEV